jgi:hypothetical protein
LYKHPDSSHKKTIRSILKHTSIKQLYETDHSFGCYFTLAVFVATAQIPKSANYEAANLENMLLDSTQKITITAPLTLQNQKQNCKSI